MSLVLNKWALMIYYKTGPSCSKRQELNKVAKLTGVDFFIHDRWSGPFSLWNLAHPLKYLGWSVKNERKNGKRCGPWLGGSVSSVSYLLTKLYAWDKHLNVVWIVSRKKHFLFIYLFMYGFISSGAGLHWTLGSDLGRRKLNICIFLIAAPAGTRRWGDSVDSMLCSFWGGSWENTLRLFICAFVTLVHFRCAVCASRHNQICLQRMYALHVDSTQPVKIKIQIQ